MAQQGIVRIVINAVDKYSSVLTGLNQGLDLVAKAFGAAQAAADIFGKVVSKAVDLARVGGAFQEQRNQFESLAKSYEVNGAKILRIVQETSANTISEFDSITIATKGLAAGFKGDDLTTALTFIKRWTEATGQSFKSVAETAFQSLASGRFSVLRQMGLVIENGSDFRAVVESMRTQLKRFGDAGFTSADQLDSLNAAQDDFLRKIGQGINSSKAFQEILGGVASAVIKTVRSFDPAPVTEFVDIVIGGAKQIFFAFTQNFPKISGIVGDVFTQLTTDSTGFARKIISQIFSLSKAAAVVANSILDTIRTLNVAGLVSDSLNKIIKATASTGASILSVLTKVATGSINLLSDALTAIQTLAQSNPKIAELLGISPQEIAEADQGLLKVRRGIEKASELLVSGIDGAAGLSDAILKDLNKNLEKSKINIEGLSDVQKSFTAEMEKTATATEVATKASKNMTDVAVTGYIELENGLRNAVVKLPPMISGLDGAAKSFKELGKTAGGEGLKGFETLTETVNKLPGAASKAEEALARIKAPGGELTIRADKTGKLGQEIDSYLTAANWPAELQALGRFLLNFILLKARGESLPLAITTVGT